MNTDKISCLASMEEIAKYKHADAEDFIKNYKYVIEQLKSKLQNAVKDNHKFKLKSVDNNNNIKHLQESLQKSNAINLKLTEEVKRLKEQNLQTLFNFATFKEKFYELEINYDDTVNKLKSRFEAYNIQLQQQQLEYNNQHEKLIQENRELQQKLIKASKSSEAANMKYEQCQANFNRLQIDFEQQQNEFQNFKRNTDINTQTLTDKFNENLEKLKKELELKEEIIAQSKMDRTLLEEEKDKIIYKHVCQIKELQHSVTQPTRRVASVTAVVNTSMDGCTNRNYDHESSNPPKRSSQISENNASDIENNKKRSRLTDEGPPLKTTRRTAALKNCPPPLPVLVSTISLDEDEDSDDSVFNMYRKNRISLDDDLYVPDTSDTSDVFDQLKKSVK